MIKISRAIAFMFIHTQHANEIAGNSIALLIKIQRKLKYVQLGAACGSRLRPSACWLRPAAKYEPLKSSRSTFHAACGKVWTSLNIEIHLKYFSAQYFSESISCGCLCKEILSMYFYTSLGVVRSLPWGLCGLAIRRLRSIVRWLRIAEDLLFSFDHTLY